MPAPYSAVNVHRYLENVILLFDETKGMYYTTAKDIGKLAANMNESGLDLNIFRTEVGRIYIEFKNDFDQFIKSGAVCVPDRQWFANIPIKTKGSLNPPPISPHMGQVPFTIIFKSNSATQSFLREMGIKVPESDLIEIWDSRDIAAIALAGGKINRVSKLIDISFPERTLT